MGFKEKQKLAISKKLANIINRKSGLSRILEFDDIIAFYNDLTFIKNNDGRIITLYTSNTGIPNDKYICFSDQEKTKCDYYNLKVEVLHKSEMSDVDKFCVLYYELEKNKFSLTILPIVNYDNTFIRDYTEDNLKLIDGI